MSPPSFGQTPPMPQGYAGTAVAAFRPNELIFSVVVAFVIEVVFFAILVSAGNTAHIKEKEEAKPGTIPISVKPVLDDLPLLKLGGKKKVRAKLPDMWKKQAPIRRYEARSAPSPDAQDSVEAIATSKVAIGDAGVPPPDAEVAAQVDEEMQPDAGDSDAQPESNVEGEGSPDGVEEGTETDPMKARWVSQYQMQILRWFNSRFTPPNSGAPCEELKRLTAAVVATVSPDKTVVGYTLARPSGNATFDARVRATMDGIVGQQLPPPPPLLGDVPLPSVSPVFSGQKAQCTPADSPSPSPSPSASP